MTTVRRTARASLVALALVASTSAGATAATRPAPDRPAHAPRHAAVAPKVAGPAFTTVRTTGFAAQSVASPAPGRVVVAGVRAAAGKEGPVVVDTAQRGRWTTRTLPARATTVRVASGNGVTWLLGVGATPTLWRSQGAGWVKVAVPAPGVTELVPRNLAAEGSSVAVWGQVRTPQVPAQGAVARLDKGRWSFRHDFFERTLYGPSTFPLATPLTALLGGHVLAETGFPGARGNTLYDYSVRPPRAVGVTSGFTPMGDVHATSDVTGRHAGDVTGWGYLSRTDQTAAKTLTAGRCLRMVAGTTKPCPAPAYEVSAATRLADGRQVVGGKDTYAVTDRATGARSGLVQGRYATVRTPGASPVPVAGEPGDAVVDLAAEPVGSTVWSVVRSGSTTRVQRAVLGAARR